MRIPLNGGFGVSEFFSIYLIGLVWFLALHWRDEQKRSLIGAYEFCGPRLNENTIFDQDQISDKVCNNLFLSPFTIYSKCLSSYSLFWFSSVCCNSYALILWAKAKLLSGQQVIQRSQVRPSPTKENTIVSGSWPDYVSCNIFRFDSSFTWIILIIVQSYWLLFNENFSILSPTTQFRPI